MNQFSEGGFDLDRRGNRLEFFGEEIEDVLVLVIYRRGRGLDEEEVLVFSFKGFYYFCFKGLFEELEFVFGVRNFVQLEIEERVQQ